MPGEIPVPASCSKFMIINTKLYQTLVRSELGLMGDNGVIDERINISRTASISRDADLKDRNSTVWCVCVYMCVCGCVGG